MRTKPVPRASARLTPKQKAKIEKKEAEKEELPAYRSIPDLRRSDFYDLAVERHQIQIQIGPLEKRKKAIDAIIIPMMYKANVLAVTAGEIPVKVVESYYDAVDKEAFTTYMMENRIPSKIIEGALAALFVRKPKAPYLQVGERQRDYNAGTTGSNER